MIMIRILVVLCWYSDEDSDTDSDKDSDKDSDRILIGCWKDSDRFLIKILIWILVGF